MPEAGDRVDFASEHDEQAMTHLGLSSKREIARSSIRVRTAMAEWNARGGLVFPVDPSRGDARAARQSALKGGDEAVRIDEAHDHFLDLHPAEQG